MANYDPLSFQQLVDSTGAVAASAKLNYYVTGTTTALPVYSDAGLTTPITQPVRADSNGICPVVFLQAKRYKRVVTTSADASIAAYTVDPLDTSEILIFAGSAPSPTFPGLRYANTSDLHTYRRNAADSAWVDEGLTDGLLNSASVTEAQAGTSTTKAMTPDATAGLWQRGSAITPNAGTVSLPSTGGGVFDINAGNFSAISSAQGGRVVVFEFAGASVITHNASSLDLPGAANITTAAGDRAAFVNLAAADASGANWRCLWFVRDDGSWEGVIATQAQMEAASNATFPVVPSVVKWHPGVAKCWAYVTVSGGTPSLDASHNITSITDTNTGRLTITIATDFSSAAWSYACSSEQPSAGTESIPNIRTSTLAAGTVEVTCSALGGTDADPASYGFQGFGDLA